MNSMGETDSLRGRKIIAPAAPRSGATRFLVVGLVVGAIAFAIFQADRAAREARRAKALSEQIRQLQRERDAALKRVASDTVQRPRLPAPRLSASELSALPSVELQPTNIYARLKDQAPRLTRDQVEAYLKANGRKPATLLSAYRTSDDRAYLKEAMEKYPNDPHVAFEAVFSKTLSADEKRQWLGVFERSAPENPLANYIAAGDYFKAGQTDLGVKELLKASGKSRFDDYTLERRQDDEEAYLAAGYPTAEGKVIASSQLKLPQLAELKQTAVQMIELSKSYRQAGDEASAQAVLQMGFAMGQGYSAADCAISHLVGMAIQRMALGAMDPNSSFDSSGQTAQQKLEQINQQKTAISQLFKDNDWIFEQMSDQDWMSYIDRDKNFGEEAALRWAISKYGQKQDRPK